MRTTLGHDPDAGVTLIELVVAMSLMTIVSAMALTFFVGVNSANSTAVDANVGTASARNVLQQWTQLLELADSPDAAGSGSGRFVEITPTSAVFYTNSDRNRATDTTARTAPVKVSLALVGGQLVESDYQPDTSTTPSTYPDSPTSTRVLASDVTTTGWLFAPYTTGNPPTLVEPNDCADGAPGLCSEDSADAAMLLATIVRVDLSFTLTSSSGQTQSFTSSAAITGSTS